MGYCSNCGNKLNTKDNFCPECGKDTGKQIVESEVKNEIENKIQNEVQKEVVVQNDFTQDNDMDKPKTNAAAVGGFVCSLVGLFIFGIVLGIISISLGVSAKNHMKIFKNEKGDGLATTAIILGIIDIVGAIIITIFKVFFYSFF